MSPASRLAYGLVRERARPVLPWVCPLVLILLPPFLNVDILVYLLHALLPPTTAIGYGSRSSALRCRTGFLLSCLNVIRVSITEPFHIELYSFRQPECPSPPHDIYHPYPRPHHPTGYCCLLYRWLSTIPCKYLVPVLCSTALLLPCHRCSLCRCAHCLHICLPPTRRAALRLHLSRWG